MQSPFKSLTGIDSAFRFTKGIAFAAIVCSLLICVYTTWSCRSLIAEERKKIYVLDNGKSLILALQQDLTTNRPVELRSHIRLFHELFFTLAPDADVIKSNISRARYLGDKSIADLYNDFNEAGYYRGVVGNNITQQIVIDNIEVNMDVYPYQITTTARQIISRRSNVSERSLITRCTAIDVQRSDNNPHGFLIENFSVVENKELTSYDKI